MVTGRVMGFEELAARLLAAPARAGGTRVLAVDGRSGSGKTTLAGRAAAVLGAPVLHVDALYPGWDGLARGVERLVGEVLDPLAAGRAARYRRWSWVHSTYQGWATVAPAPVLVVEGVGAGARAAAARASLLVWVEAPPVLRRARAMARDGDAYRPYWERWAAQEDALLAVEATPARADLLVDGTAPADPSRLVLLAGGRGGGVRPPAAP